LANVLFNEWPKRDLEAAAAALSEPGTIGARMGWRMQVATTVMDNSVERGLQLMFDWHIENYGPRMGALSKWAAANPLHAAQFVIDHPSGYVSRLAMETIGKAWAQTDPVGALRFAETHQGSLGLELANATLKLWVERDLGDARAWLAQADATTRNRLSPSFVESWAKQDPGGALSWCEEMLTGSSMAQGVGSALKGAAAKDVSGAAALVSAMEPSAARMEAAAAVSRKWFPELSSSSPKDLKPEAVSWLSNLDPQSIERVLREVVWGWSSCDARSLAEFLSEAQVKQVPEHAYSVTARQLARTDPLAALDWAHRLPDNQGLEAGGEAFAEWRSSQPEAAMKWYNELASNDPRRQPFFEGAIRNLAFHPQAVEQLAAMPRADKVQARSVIAGLQYLPEEKRSRLLEALNVQ
jgi:hypothetical protein